MDWFRKSELSSDRFSLLATGDLETVQSVIRRLAGGASSEKDELSTDEFRLQAKEFRETVEARKRGSIKDTIEYYTSSLMLQDAMNTHAWPTIRFVEIEDWAKSRQYGLIAQGDLAEAERHPFQYLPETVADDGLGTAELIDSTDEPEPVLRQAASETVGLWKNRVALRQLRRPLNAPRRNAFRVTEWHCQVGEFAWSLPRSVVGRGSAAEHRQAPLHAAASRQRPGTS